MMMNKILIVYKLTILDTSHSKYELLVRQIKYTLTYPQYY
jgi:hypothetical protein